MTKQPSNSGTVTDKICIRCGMPYSLPNPLVSPYVEVRAFVTRYCAKCAESLPIHEPIVEIPAGRRYVPAIGDRVRLRTISDYTSRHIGVWDWLDVQGITLYRDEPQLNYVSVEVLDGPIHTGQFADIPLSAIERPIGWQDRYTIQVSADQLQTAVSMLTKGVVIRQSQYIGDSSTQFQPMGENGTAEKSHWKFGEVTDRIPADQTKDLIRLVRVDSSDAGIDSACQWCANGTIGVYRYGGIDHPCTCKGSGIGRRYLSEMLPKERKKVIGQLERDGWKVWYQRQGQVWRMERETVVKEWGQDVKPEYQTVGRPAAVDPSDSSEVSQ